MARRGVPLRHRSSIWPDTYDHMASLRADILVTHEAPSCHRHGFAAIDRLAEVMGVQALFHGHHHEPRRYHETAGYRVHSVGFRAITNMYGGIVLPGEAER